MKVPSNIRRRVKAPPRRSSVFPRILLAVLVMFAWSWLAVILGMIFFRSHTHEEQRETPRQQQLSVQNMLQQRVSRKYSSPSLDPHASPLLIFTCNRDEYLRQTLADVLAALPDDCRMGCPIIVSQDGNNEKVSQVVDNVRVQAGARGIPVVHWHHPSDSKLRGTDAYHKLAVHYGWALGKIFAPESPATRVIILEEDIHISPDFFGYFRAVAPILDQDETLLAASAFNDNGYEGRVTNRTRVLRSDFFPGLGWMMTRKLWVTDIGAKFPNGYWDDWLREPAQRKGRHILRPEVSRTFHFGVKGGASGNQFGGRLQKIMLNKEDTNWEASQSQLFDELQPTTFTKSYLNLIKTAQSADSLPQALEMVDNGNVRLQYPTWKAFKVLARKLGLMDDEKAGIPRTAYRGVVEIRPKGKHILFLTPAMEMLETDFSVDINI